MSTRVIQGFFVGGAMRPMAGILQPAGRRPGSAAQAPARPAAGPPAPAFAGRQGVVQPRGGNGSFDVDATRLGLVRNGGNPLPAPLLAKMEAAFGADFSAVRVHIGPQAARIGAVAFTTGNDLYFAPGRYQPDSVQGQQLIGHELAHVIQQRQGRVRATGSGVSVVQDHALEAEADRLGMRAAMHQGPAQPRQALQRVSSQAQPVQRMQDTISARVGKRNKMGRIKSERVRGNYEYTGETIYYDAKKKGKWNNKSRPQFIDHTWYKMWKKGGFWVDNNNDRLYPCYQCNGYFLRKKDAPHQSRNDDATIDHVINWKQYIHDNAEPDEDGRITSDGALYSYNDKRNLKTMCRSCNAAKNGPKNVFD